MADRQLLCKAMERLYPSAFSGQCALQVKRVSNSISTPLHLALTITSQVTDSEAFVTDHGADVAPLSGSGTSLRKFLALGNSSSAKWTRCQIRHCAPPPHVGHASENAVNRWLGTTSARKKSRLKAA
ncbi:hypothetical protein SH139x_002491 [Planctomycetaceae bacterium SH139]